MLFYNLLHVIYIKLNCCLIIDEKLLYTSWDPHICKLIRCITIIHCEMTCLAFWVKWQRHIQNSSCWIFKHHVITKYKHYITLLHTVHKYLHLHILWNSVVIKLIIWSWISVLSHNKLNSCKHSHSSLS